MQPRVCTHTGVQRYVIQSAHFKFAIAWAAFCIETFTNVLQNFLSLVHDCCGTFANCFDTERSPALISESRNLAKNICDVSKLKRMPPLSVAEQELLVSLIDEKVDVVECKKTDIRS